MLIRSAEVADVSALLPLFKQWGHELTEEAVSVVPAEWHHTPGAEIVVAEIEGSVVGMAAVSTGPLFARPGR